MTSQGQLLGQARQNPARVVTAVVDASTRRLWGAVQAFLYGWRAERARAELRGLSDRTLADIGLSRAQIESLYREGSRPASHS